MTSSNPDAKSPIQTRIESLIQEFSAQKSWEERYKLLIDKGKSLPTLPESFRNETYKVQGCQSQVWFHASLFESTHDDSNSSDNSTKAKRIQFVGDSDAMIVKGLIAILFSVYSNVSASEILSTPPDFLRQLGFDQHLSPSRANGLYAMVKRIFTYAQAFQILEKTQS